MKRAHTLDPIWRLNITQNLDDYKNRGSSWCDTDTYLFSSKDLALKFLNRFKRRKLRYDTDGQYESFDDFNNSAEYCNEHYSFDLEKLEVMEEVSESSDESSESDSESSDESLTSESSSETLEPPVSLPEVKEPSSETSK